MWQARRTRKAAPTKLGHAYKKKKKNNNKTIRNQQTLGLSHVIACHNVDDKSTTHSGVKAKYLDLFLIF